MFLFKSLFLSKMILSFDPGPSITELKFIVLILTVFLITNFFGLQIFLERYVISNSFRNSSWSVSLIFPLFDITARFEFVLMIWENLAETSSSQSTFVSSNESSHEASFCFISYMK